MIHFLVHGAEDNVAVAVADAKKGDACICMNLETKEECNISPTMDVPLGHKIALNGFKVDDTIIKYDNDIGKVVSPIKKGDHVHVHNVRTKYW